MCRKRVGRSGFHGGVVASVLLTAGTLFAAPGDWPQWRGPDRSGVGDGGPRLARAWPSGLVKLWENGPIPANDSYGWSTPSVADGRVYLYVGMPISGQWRDVFFCINATNGATLWKKDYPGVQLGEGSSSTVCIDGGRLYGVGSNGADLGPMLYCLSASDGSEIWKVRGTGWWEQKMTHSSFLIADGVAVIQGGGHDGPNANLGRVVALDAATGTVLWTQPKYGGQGSPMAWCKDGKTYVLSLARDGLSCFDLGTGNLQWTALPGGSSHTPAVSGDYAAFLSDGYPDNGLVCLKLATNRAEVVWQIPGQYDSGSSVVIYNGYVYATASNAGEPPGPSSRSRILCVKLDTGEVAWNVAMPAGCGAYSSPVIVDGKLFATLECGDKILMAEASPEGFWELGRTNVVSASGFGITYGVSPIIAGGRLFARTGPSCWANGTGSIACYDLTDKGNHPPMIVSPASANPNPVPLPNTCALIVAARDQDNDPLTYTWSKESGPGTVSFSPNGTNASASSTAGFGAAGAYVLRVIVSDGRGGSVTSDVAATVVTPGIVTSSTSVNVPEGGTATFQAKLAAQPASDVTVTVARTAGDTDVSVSGGASLNFTTANWDTFQTVTLAAAQDADATNGAATITCSAAGLNSAMVVAAEADDETTLTVNACLGGTTSPTGATIVTKGAATTVTATPAAGYSFVTWMVTGGAASIADANAATATVTIADAAAVQAYFAANTVAIVNTAKYYLPSVPEGGTATFRVKLSAPPAADVTVSVARMDGDTDITVQSGGSLNFATTNWNTYQTVTLAAAQDADATNDTASIVCSADGLNSVTVTVTEVEDDATLTVCAGAGGTTTPSGETVVPKGVATTVTATPSNGYTFTNWTVIGGSPRIGNAGAASTSVTIDSPTTICANFTSGGGNRAPTIVSPASASPNPVTLPYTAVMHVVASDPDADPLTYTWGAVSGTGTVTFTPNGTGASDSSTASFDAQGTYILRVTVSDGKGGSVSSDVTVVVHPQPMIYAYIAGGSVPEGGTAMLQMFLWSQPAGTVTVTVSRTAGDADITVQSGSNLTFTTSNWSTWQNVTLAAAQDADTNNGTATITCSGPGLIAATVTATEADNDTTLTVDAGAIGTTAPSGATVVTKGAATTVKATPASGYAFANWTVTAGSAAITNAPSTNATVTITAPATIRANFVLTDSNIDSDGDGMTDAKEFLAGTDPANAASVLALSAPAVNAAQPGECVVSWQSATNKKYTLQGTTNLLTGFNLNLCTNIPATPPVNVHTDNVVGADQKFYRVRVE